MEGINLEDGQDGLYNKDKAKAQLEKRKLNLKRWRSIPNSYWCTGSTNSKDLFHGCNLWNKQWKKLLVKTMLFLIFKWWTKTKCWNYIECAISCRCRLGPSRNGRMEPDYDDPSTYLDTSTIFRRPNKVYLGFAGGVDNHQQKQLVGWVCKTSCDANNETQRCCETLWKKYAAAQAWLTDSAIVIPTMSSTGAATAVSKVVPFSDHHLKQVTRI